MGHYFQSPTGLERNARVSADGLWRARAGSNRRLRKRGGDLHECRRRGAGRLSMFRMASNALNDVTFFQQSEIATVRAMDTQEALS